jgi:acyl-CoA synthetase (AMP-forming)/AMP-acid ligase II
MNNYFLLDQAARRFPDHGAVFRGSDQLLTFSELRSRALRLAAGLRAVGRPGDRVALVSENCPEYVELFFGTWAANMAVAPVNAKLHPKEMVQILEDSGASVAFVSAKIIDALADAVRGSPAAACRLVIIGGADYAAMLREEWQDPIESDPADLAWLFFTSGTTGRSKGAMLSHRNLNACTFAHLADMEPVDENSSLLHAAPMSHGSGLYIPAYIARAARQVVPASGAYDPAEFLGLCESHPGVGAFLAPTMVQRLRLQAESSGARPRNLRSIIYGGAPMYVEELRKAIAVFGQVFIQIYGQGEAPMTITGLRRADHAVDNADVLGSAGYPRLGVEVAVVGEGGAPLPVGEVGEIVCRGDIVMSGYWNNPKATADALKDGWLFTGDMGSFDEKGLLTLRDRSKDVVISGGTNVYPREVEEVLLASLIPNGARSSWR